MEKTYQRLLQECLNEFGRGVNCSSDYNELSDSILAKTGKYLSSSTIKRLFGYVRYDNIPRLSTLNILAQYAGYRDYNDFTGKKPDDSGQSGKPRALKRIYVYSAVAVALISLIVLVIYRPAKVIVYDSDKTEVVGGDEPVDALKKFREDCVTRTIRECERIRSHRETMEDEDYKAYAYDEYIKYTFTDLKNYVNDGLKAMFPDDDEMFVAYSGQIFSECQDIAVVVVRELY